MVDVDVDVDVQMEMVCDRVAHESQAQRWNFFLPRTGVGVSRKLRRFSEL